MRRAGAVTTGLGWAFATVAVGILTFAAAPRLVGGTSYAVLSDSMRGSVGTGAQVIVMPRRMSDVGVGEIVAFTDPEGSGKLLQHRVQRVERRGRQIEVVTMGDANSGWERWSLPASESVGRVVAVLPFAGYVFGPIGRPHLRRLAAAAAWLAILVLVLASIWRRPREGASPEPTADRR